MLGFFVLIPLLLGLGWTPTAFWWLSGSCPWVAFSSLAFSYGWEVNWVQHHIFFLSITELYRLRLLHYRQYTNLIFPPYKGHVSELLWGAFFSTLLAKEVMEMSVPGKNIGGSETIKLLMSPFCQGTRHTERILGHRDWRQNDTELPSKSVAISLKK